MGEGLDSCDKRAKALSYPSKGRGHRRALFAYDMGPSNFPDPLFI